MRTEQFHHAESSRRRLEELQSRLRCINEQKLQIERQREKLRQDALRLLKEYKPIEEELLTEADTYSKAWGCCFGEQLYKLLPRELRDIIYEELVVSPEPVDIKSVTDVDPWGGWGSWSDDPIPLNYVDRVADIRKSHQRLVSPAYLGIAVASEITEAFYKRNVFSISDSADIENFLTLDIFQMDNVPGDLIRKLKVSLPDLTIVSDWNWDGSGFGEGPAQSSNDTTQDTYGAKLNKSAALQKLSLVKNKNSCEIEFVVCTGVRYVLHPFLANLGDLVYGLRDRGFKIRVSQQPRRMKKKKKKHATGQKIYASPGKDWTHLFDISKEEWKEKAKSKTLFGYVVNLKPPILDFDNVIVEENKITLVKTSGDLDLGWEDYIVAESETF
ncbi:uncharacterized protein BDR25DRAFT_307971 [Lindgomyces ingoldianus]|uniref:Uncharacterized protein n=1 Tax=Lindgomyces ingoldianus TaxID=673940 RepID=A0ACB6Q860_9PLEO|nr:uncharacterized protein BDR25DRAFT_307971 [Lindgomyces ingoldianus]KAF2463066.1 hypothetical protein BDR25DRAFT_307971 [Lindgomyces ingoldianus]